LPRFVNKLTILLGTAGQLAGLGFAGVLGYEREGLAWLIPLTIGLTLVGWLTDHYWALRFYDVYDLRKWTRFWLETLFGIACFVFAAYAAGRIVRQIAEVYGAGV
jgi:hypothetical protein